MTPLPDDMAWLDGLSDEEYDAYWDEVERCVPMLECTDRTSRMLRSRMHTACVYNMACCCHAGKKLR